MNSMPGALFIVGMMFIIFGIFMVKLTDIHQDIKVIAQHLEKATNG